MYLSRSAPSATPCLLCKIASEGETIKSQTIYFLVTQPDILLSDNKTNLGKGADGNRFKDSIDDLLRSAAHFLEQVMVSC